MSFASASTTAPEVRTDAVVQGGGLDCYRTDFSFNPNLYRQPGDRMKDDQPLPSTISFSETNVEIRPAGENPCGGGGGGGGGGDGSCLE